MAEPTAAKAEEVMNINDTVILREVPVGQKVLLRSGAIAEITANPEDGAWVFIKIVSNAKDPSKVGEEEMAFCTEVIGLVN